MLAALMSSLASAFNSCSTLLTWDVYRKLRPDASGAAAGGGGTDHHGAAVGLGLLWIPFMKYISPQIYIYLQSVQAYIAPPIAACFLLGVLYPRLNGTGALAALWTGLVIGTARLVLELARNDLGSGTVWYWFATINFLHFAALLFCPVLGDPHRGQPDDRPTRSGPNGRADGRCNRRSPRSRSRPAAEPQCRALDRPRRHDRRSCG